MTDYKVNTPIPNKRKANQEFLVAYTPDHPHTMPNPGTACKNNKQLETNAEHQIYYDDQSNFHNIFKGLPVESNKCKVGTPERRSYHLSGSPRVTGIPAFRISSQQHQQASKQHSSPMKHHLIDTSDIQQHGFQPGSIKPIYILTPNAVKDSEENGIQRFPSEFNPRQAANMPHKEKIDKWIVNVPAYPSQFKEAWYNDCYPTVVDISGASTPDQSEVDLTNPQDVIEFQSRLITFFVNRSYLNDTTEVITKGEDYEGSGPIADYSYESNDEYEFHDTMY